MSRVPLSIQAGPERSEWKLSMRLVDVDGLV